jgi:predicted metalloprotease with PDZ domain
MGDSSLTRSGRHLSRLVAAVALLVAPLATSVAAQPPPIEYRVSFPAAEHHWAQVEVTFPRLPAGVLQARMSRSSPGRYAAHDFAKNVFDVQAFDGTGKAVTPTRPNPAEWDVAGHDGTVRIAYRIYGDRVDGTYLGIDTTHAHINMPATLMWARGLENRPVRIRFEPPTTLSWKVATQLFPTSDPWTFTAPNMQYLMDSPTELSAHSVRSFSVRNPDGKTFTIRAAVHHDATDADVDEYAAGVEKIVRETVGVFGEFPEFETGTYTFLGDYVPWGGGDGMEHRNSTVVAAPRSIKGAVARTFGTVSHEFFHAWNVERIRPRSLEPFNFEDANISGELWLAEGFTQYYGELILQRAGLVPLDQTIRGMGGAANAVINGAGRQFHSAVEMSQLAPFVDAATAIDRTNLSTTFISYYTHGAAIALALDLSLRDRSNGRVTLDDYMRAMWRVHGKPGGPQPGLVGKPYTLQDARDRLAEVSDRAFADEFFSKYIEGRDVVDYARLFARAGILFRRQHPGAAWLGTISVEASGRVTSLVEPGTPAARAGFDQDDVITSVDGKPFGGTATLASVVSSHAPGDRISIEFKHPDGASGTGVVTLTEDPTMEAVPVESTGGTPTAEQKAFRAAWLARNGSDARRPGQ